MPVACRSSQAPPTRSRRRRSRRIEITGSSIKRVQDEGALPVQVITPPGHRARAASPAPKQLVMTHLGQRHRRRQPVVERRHPARHHRPQQQRQLERQPARPRRHQHAGAAERPAPLDARRQGQRGRPELDPARRGRARRGAEGRRLGDLRHRRHRRRHQLHPAQGLQRRGGHRLHRHHRGRRRQHPPRLAARGLGRPVQRPLQRDGQHHVRQAGDPERAASAASPTATSPSAASRPTPRARPSPRRPASPAPPSAPVLPHARRPARRPSTAPTCSASRTPATRSPGMSQYQFALWGAPARATPAPSTTAGRRC